jgi:zona occludens toxin (predicted ATPase)
LIGAEFHAKSLDSQDQRSLPVSTVNDSKGAANRRRR